jgi:hypothetical protein
MTGSRKTITARRALTKGLPRDPMTTTPYHHDRGSARWVRIDGIRPGGSTHVELRSAETGVWFLVDKMHPIFSVAP